MTRYRGRPWWGGPVGLGLLAALAVLLAGCATTSSLPGHDAAAPIRFAAQDRPAAPAAQLAVVRRWASQLRVGNLRGAAAEFHLPMLFENGIAIVIRSSAEAEAANATLSCGAQVISAFQEGRFINVLFRLIARAGRGGGRRACGSGIGETARTVFLIHDGKILEWRRAPSLPGDPGVPGSHERHHGSGGSSGPSLAV